MSENLEAKWYVVHTYSGYENKVASNLETTVENRNLQDLIQEIKVPTETVIETGKDNKPREVERKVFPSYVLVKMILTDDTWFIVRNIRGCTGFVGPSAKPMPLTDEEVAALGVEKVSVELNFTVGDNVEIITGPFEGSVGIVENISIETGTVNVMTSVFGRETPVELELEQVRLAE